MSKNKIKNSDLARALRERLEQDGISKEFLDEKFIIDFSNDDTTEENKNDWYG